MAIDFFEIQKAVHTAINVSAVTSLLGANQIFARVPDTVSPVFPYITYGTPISVPVHNQCGRWDDILFHIDTWTRDTALSSGQKACYDIQLEIRKILDNQKITISGASCMFVKEQNFTILDDGDGRTWHGIQAFAIGVSPS